jgi:hypothetical protein
MSERFQVATVSGYADITAGGRAVLGVSAHVIDWAYNCRVVISFRSEDHDGLLRRRIGDAEAIRRAETLAAKLNWVSA